MPEPANRHPARAAVPSSCSEATGRFLRSLVVMATLASPTSGFAGPVHEAARDGDLTRVRQLIGEDPKRVKTEDDHRLTPLHWAAANGHEDVMKLLLDRGADPNARTDLGLTPLLLAKDCRKDLIVVLADRGADVRARGDNGWTALHWAAQNGSQDAAIYLLAKGLSVAERCKGPFGTPLTMAAANGKTEVAKLLLAKGADVDVRTEEGNTPLHEAASRGHERMVELLLSRQADVNARRPKAPGSRGLAEAGETPLHDAVQRGHEEVVRLLIKGGADVNVRSDSGRTPLHLAAGKGRAGIVKRLIDAGADLSVFGDDGRAPLHAIVTAGDVDSVALLLDRGADVNVRSKPSSARPGLRAGGAGHPPTSGNTPLHDAVSADRADMVKLLLTRWADVNARNSAGQTPLRLAKSKAVEDLIREAGGGEG